MDVVGYDLLLTICRTSQTYLVIRSYKSIEGRAVSYVVFKAEQRTSCPMSYMQAKWSYVGAQCNVDGG
ncbi:hypothetical protein N7541_005703 [Penicillium brevicompactum]|uniref:Uncharacterized protein n=1 Tax=Penicillium brevicompactum TaxID=5074 RepID=A0A9W9R8K9_PENBR|nr:hypothetical protein N7541_005703 [Penicillium brevicompactum]